MSAMGSDIRQAVKNIESLPVMPVVAQELLRLDLTSDAGEQQLLRLIAHDPMMSAKIISLANAPYYMASRKVTSVNDAAMLLGLSRVKSVALGVAMMSLAGRKSNGLNANGLWQHSMSIAMSLQVLARAMPRNRRPLEDEMFLAGLLHDMGYIVLDHLDPQSSQALHARFASDKGRLSTEIEAEMLEMNHGELGEALANAWHLPDAVAAVMRWHHDPECTETGQPLVRMVNIAERLISAVGIDECCASDITPDQWQSLGIDPENADALVENLREQVAAAREAIGSLH